MTELFQKSTVILSELPCLFGPFAFESSHPTWPTPPSFATLILILVWPQALPKTNIQSLIPFASSTSVPISFSWPPWACSEISGSGPFKKLQSRGQHQILWPSFSHIISDSHQAQVYRDNHRESRTPGPCSMHKVWWDSDVPRKGRVLEHEDSGRQRTWKYLVSKT